MSQDLVKVPTALAKTEQQLAEIQEAFAVNMGNSPLAQSELPRIKIMSGAALWLIPRLEGEETAARIEGVVVYKHDARVYFKKTGALGNTPPECSSPDAIRGIGMPGGDCKSCPLAQWDSAEDEHGNKEKGQACKLVMHLFMLRGDSNFPELVVLPPTSLGDARKFFLQMTTQGIQYQNTLVAIELQKATNAQGKPYGKATFKFLRCLNPEEAVAGQIFAGLARTLADNITRQGPVEEAQAPEPGAPAPAGEPTGEDGEVF